MAVRACVVRGAWLWLAVMTMWRSASLAWSSSEHNIDIEKIPIWPMPANVEYGMNENYILAVKKNFSVAIIGQYPGSAPVLQRGISRFLKTIHLLHDQVEMVEEDGLTDKAAGTLSSLRGLRVNVESWDDQLQFGIDESYELKVPDPDSPNYAYLKAKNVYGALYGLETLSQLCFLNFTRRRVIVPMAPWTIIDQPRFSYRGLLIDTARHFQPLEMIKKVIDAMAYSKLNVLHWHIVDTQSFPLEIPSLPKLWNGAYSPSERYTMKDAHEIVEYARMRGINVLAEIDVPGHAGSWGIGYPHLWPSYNCQQPLDVSKEFTFKVIDTILSDFSKVFKFKFIHLGGDEVNTSCWSNTTHIRKWLAKRGLSTSEAYKYFVLRAQKIALSHGYEPINWEETFNDFGRDLNPKTVVHNWLGGGVAPKVVERGLRCIVSNQDSWYLDHLQTTWEQFYLNEPLTNITNPQQQKLLLGGEVCMWGETVDASDIEQTIWPRAAAAAERLWTPYDKIAKDPNEVVYRLANFRCLLNQRGVSAAPLFQDGRGPPIGPGSCYSQ